jgi:hypothetical protein
MSNFDHSKIKFSSDRERASYFEGVKILAAKRKTFAAARIEQRIPSIVETAVAGVLKRYEANPAAFIAPKAKTISRPSPAKATVTQSKSFGRLTLHRYCSGSFAD